MMTLQERVHGFPPPASWQPGKLHRVFRVRKGVKNAGMQEDNLLSLSYGRIIQKDIDAAEGLLPESFETYQIVESGNIVMRLTDLQNDKRSLRQGLVTQRGIITSAYDALEVGKDHDSRFWAYVLLALDLAKYYYSLGGGVRQSIKFADFPNEWIGVPNPETQRAIAHFLDRETARIDQLIEKKQRIIERFGQKLESLVHEGIVASSTENVRFGFTASRVYRPVDLKSGASFVRLGLYNRGRGVFKKPEADEEDMGDSSFFWVEPGDLILSGQFAWEGAVALASAGEAGCVVSHRYPVYSGTNRATTAYLLAFLRTKMGDFILNEASRGSAGRNRPLNVNRLEKEKIPIPNATLQARIGEIVSLEMEIRRKIQRSIDLLQEHRSALITAAVTGQIDVATWRKRGTTDRRLDAIEADMTAAAQPERQQVQA